MSVSYVATLSVMDNYLNIFVTIINVWCNALHLSDKEINSHETRFNLFWLLTNSTQRICLVARGGRELVTFISQSPTLSLYTTHVDNTS